MSNKIFHFLILAYATIFAQGCSFLEDFIDDEEHNETIETEYKLSTSDINGYDQMIYSDRVCHLYKANDNNLPHSITSFITDENNELHIIHYSFDDNGIPNYIIFDNQSIYLDNINGTTYDMTVINPDGTFFTLDNIDTGIDIASYWDNISTLTKAEPGMSYPEYAFALTKHLIGGVTMAQGGVMMLMGCAMLVPGANVAVGATLMLTGGAQFLAGALLTTRATDQIVSDGSHTEGFDQMASGLSLSSAMGGLTTAGTKISSEICKLIRTAVLEAGYDGAERFLREHRTECDESKEKVKDFYLISGDKRDTVIDVATNIGISECYSELLPNDKVNTLNDIMQKKNKKEKLLFAGIGQNNKECLEKADVGVTLKINNDNFNDKADCYILSDKISKIAETIKISRKTKGIINECIYSIIMFKIAILVLVGLGYANMWMVAAIELALILIVVLHSMKILKY
jgi:soluble P-type ATPase